MEYAFLGKTGRKVSRVGFGGATAGIPGYINPFDPRDAADRNGVVNAVRRAYESGITYFDTAEGYGDGASEEIFGEGLSGADKEKIFLATKVTPYGKYGLRGPDEIRRSLENSLKRLKRGYVDLLQIHGSYYGAETAESIIKDGGIADAMARFKEESLVKFIGFSIETQNTALDLFIESGRFDCMQIQYNLLFQHPYDPSFAIGSLYKAEAAGLGIVAMRTATSGIFQKWIKIVNPADTFNYTPALIQFVLSNPFIDTALIGMRTEREVDENISICGDLSGRIDLSALHDRFPKKI